MADPEPGVGSPALRLFLALWPEAPALRSLLAWRELWRWQPGTRVQPPERLHLTLHFIGAVPAERLHELRRGLVRPCPTFELRLDRAELWPGGLAMLCPSAPPEALLQLHAELAEALDRLALPAEQRPFRPHVTLARKAAGAQAPELAPELSWPVRGYVLAQSLQGYHILQRYPGDEMA